MDFPVLILAGYSGAGKTTIAREFSRRFGYGFIEHQKLVHDIAKSRGFARARHWLHETGINNFVNDSLLEMHSRINLLKETGIKGVITDVAYGENMIRSFKGWFPQSQVIVASVLVDKKIRESRVGGRMGGVERGCLY
ncbi:MAG: hypothetical protein AAB599_01260 [Patescibacteria group bacterium]